MISELPPSAPTSQSSLNVQQAPPNPGFGDIVPPGSLDFMQFSDPNAVASTMFLVMGGVCLVIFLFLALLHGLAAAGIGKRKRWLLAIVLAVLHLPSFPLGTAFGAFAMYVLFRPSVKQLFGRL